MIFNQTTVHISRACYQTLEQLTSRVQDLYLIHWPTININTIYQLPPSGVQLLIDEKILLCQELQSRFAPEVRSLVFSWIVSGTQQWYCFQWMRFCHVLQYRFRVKYGLLVQRIGFCHIWTLIKLSHFLWGLLVIILMYDHIINKNVLLIKK